MLVHSTRYRVRLLLATAIGAFLLTAAAAAQQESSLAPLAPGASFPTGRYANLNAKAGDPAEIELASHLGQKPIILYYWIPGNRRSEEMFQQLQGLVQDLGPDRIALLGVAVPRPGRGEDVIRERLGSLGIRVPVLNDADYRIGKRLLVQSVPNVTIIDSRGVLRLSNGASLQQVLGYKLDLAEVIRRTAEDGKLMTYGYLDRYFPVRELEGKKSPDFRASLLGGGERSWHSLLDDSKLNVLIFWSVDCPHCRKSLPEINDWLVDHREGVNVVSCASIDTETEEGRTREFCEEHGFVFPTLIDRGARVGALFKVTTTPTIVIMGPDGVVDSSIVSGYSDVGRTLERKMKQLLGS